jgi:glyoxylase-like metal-dependent hydrolase (beta-lactamase superfamily II)
LATARRFVEEGACVFITGRRQKELDEAVKAIGANVSGVQGDIAQLADLDRLYETVAQVKRRIDIVFANAGLMWEVFLAPSIPAIAPDMPPGETARPWPPISSTLISGEHDAVLVDTPITVEQSRALVNWLVARGKNLTTIYATHGHGDHFFGTSTILERFPGARFVARPEVIKIMRQQASRESLETFWNPRFPDQISSQLAIAEELTGNVISLEGHDLVSVPLGFTDTASTTCLHVPSIGLIVAGDAAYNGDHLHLSESPDQQKRQEWIAALDTMESLKARAVVAGHKRVGNDDSPRIIGETRGFIRDFERLVMQTTTARELYDEMLRLYPDWINRGALWSSVLAVKPLM